MPLLTWDSKYSVKVKQFDAQHRKLFDLLNDLHDGMKAGQGRSMIGDVVAALIEYTASHFATEERIMKDNAYPEYEQHKKEHTELITKVHTLQQQFMSGNAPLTQEIMNFL